MPTKATAETSYPCQCIGHTNEQQECKTKEANAASHDFPDELGLPNEWIY